MSLAERHVVLKRVNGHFEAPQGPNIESFDAYSEAVEKARELSLKYPNLVFAPFTMRGQAQMTKDPVEYVEVTNPTEDK